MIYESKIINVNGYRKYIDAVSENSMAEGEKSGDKGGNEVEVKAEIVSD